MGALLGRIKFPTLVKMMTSEVTRISDTLAASIAEAWMRMYSLFDCVPASGVVEGFICLDSGTGMAVKVVAGLAFRYSMTGIDLSAENDHPYRLLSMRADTTVTLDPGHATLDRIDRVCVTDAEADARLTNVPIYNPATHAFGGQNKYLSRRNVPSVVRVTGTPDASPVAPSTPAGYLSLYTVRVPAGATDLSGATFTDARTRLYGPGGLWPRLVQKAGDTMSGSLAMTLLKLSGTAQRMGVQLGMTANCGLQVENTEIAAPVGTWRGTGSDTGVNSHWAAGNFYAANYNYYGGPKGVLSRLYFGSGLNGWEFRGTDGNVPNTWLNVGHVRLHDDCAAAVAATIREMAAPLVPYCLAGVVTHPAPNPPTFDGTPWNVDAANCTHATTGLYKIRLQVAPGTLTLVPVAVPRASSAMIATCVVTATEIWVYMWDAAGIAADTSFSLVAWAMP